MKKKKQKQDKNKDLSVSMRIVKFLFYFIGWSSIFLILGVATFFMIKRVFAATYNNKVCTFQRPLGYRYYQRNRVGIDPYYSITVNQSINNNYFSGNQQNLSLNGVNIFYSNVFNTYVFQQTVSNGGYSANYYYIWKNNTWNYTNSLSNTQMSTQDILYMMPSALQYGPIIPIFNNKNYYDWWINNALGYYKSNQSQWFSINKAIMEGFNSWECERAYKGLPITAVTFNNIQRSLLTPKFQKIEPSSSGSCPPLPIAILFGMVWCVKHGL
ncbi:MAG: hypothetical protein ACYCTB_11100 [bacterium]